VNRFLLVALIGYAVVAAGVVFGLVSARESVQSSLNTEASQQDWEAWRKQVEQQAPEERTVQRSIPRSAEPPALVLLRDHFGVCLVASLIMSSVLYWTLAFFVRGATANSTYAIDVRDVDLDFKSHEDRPKS
jgi:hypothetical protein